MTPSFDVIIVGGGVVGLTAAVGMGEKGYSVALIDAGPLQVDTSKPDLRVYAVNENSKQLFHHLGVWSYLDKSRVSDYQYMHVWDSSTGAVINFDCRLAKSNHLGAIIEESIIKDALLQKLLKFENVTLFSECSIDNVSRDDTILLKSNEQAWEGKLLIATDGAQSPCREKLNVPITSWPYHQNALVAMVEVEKPHQDTAWQVFNEDGPLAFLPLCNPHQCSIVWSTRPGKAQHLCTLNEDSFNHKLSEAFAHKLGETKVISKRFSFPLMMRQAKRYAGDNWLLAGDAAHTIHPLAGLGLNVGLADITCMLNHIQGNLDNLNFKKALGAYHRQRKTEVWKMILLMQGLKGLFSSPLTPVKTLRKFGLNFTNHTQIIKKILIQQAMGNSFPVNRDLIC